MPLNPRRLPEREARFRELRAPGTFGDPLYWYDGLSSTNDRAKILAAEGAPEGSLVVADEQWAGRGRRGRSWFSPPGEGLWFSVILRPRLALDGAEAVLRLNRLGAEAVTRALETGWNVPAGVKEPNDVLVRGKKICGILCESSLAAGSRHADWLVVGCGLNLRTRLPAELEAKATRLADWVAPCPEAEELLARICLAFEAFAAMGDE